MAKIAEFTPEQQAEFDEWVASRPPHIAEMIEQRPPDRLYRIPAGQRVVIYSYADDRTVTVSVLAKYNHVMFERRVFGISIDDLIECDLPGDDEVVGAVLTEQSEIDQFIEIARPILNRESDVDETDTES